MAIRGKAGQAELTNEDLYKDIVEQNVRFAMSFTGAYMSLFFLLLSPICRMRCRVVRLARMSGARRIAVSTCRSRTTTSSQPRTYPRRSKLSTL